MINGVIKYNLVFSLLQLFPELNLIEYSRQIMPTLLLLLLLLLVS